MCTVFCILDNREDRTIESNENNLKLRTTLYDVYSRIRLTPTADDDDANYTCEARHEALPSDMTLKTSVQLSVLCKYMIFFLVFKFRNTIVNSFNIEIN